MYTVSQYAPTEQEQFFFFLFFLDQCPTMDEKRQNHRHRVALNSGIVITTQRDFFTSFMGKLFREEKSKVR